MVTNTGSPGPNESRTPRLLDRVRDALLLRHYSVKTVEAYLGWTRRFILFHGKRHPSTLGAAEVSAFLSALATKNGVSASTQNQALAALVFLYADVLGCNLPWLQGIVRAKRPARLPVVMSRAEVARVLGSLRGTMKLMASLLYGSGIRLEECLRLRVKDLDFAAHEVQIRQGKGRKDRSTVLPARLVEPLKTQLAKVRDQHAADLQKGGGSVALPNALRAKYPNAAREWRWQWVFPATRTYLHEASGERRRHHLHETVLQRAVRAAVAAANVNKLASCHTFRNASA